MAAEFQNTDMDATFSLIRNSFILNIVSNGIFRDYENVMHFDVSFWNFNATIH